MTRDRAHPAGSGRFSNALRVFSVVVLSLLAAALTVFAIGARFPADVSLRLSWSGFLFPLLWPLFMFYVCWPRNTVRPVLVLTSISVLAGAMLVFN